MLDNQNIKDLWRTQLKKKDGNPMHCNCQSEDDLKKIHNKITTDVEMKSA